MSNITTPNADWFLSSFITYCVGIIAIVIGSYFIFVVNTLRRELQSCKETRNRELDDIKGDIKELREAKK